jgi:hypothetical protein
MDILISDAVVFFEVRRGLNFEHCQSDFAWDLHEMHDAKGIVDGLEFAHQFDLVFDGNMGRSLDHDPVLGRMQIAMKAAQRRYYSWSKKFLEAGKKAFVKHDRSRFIPPGKTAKGLAQINAQNLDVHQMLLSPAIPATVAAGWREGSSSH